MAVLPHSFQYPFQPNGWNVLTSCSIPSLPSRTSQPLTSSTAISFLAIGTSPLHDNVHFRKTLHYCSSSSPLWNPFSWLATLMHTWGIASTLYTHYVHAIEGSAYPSRIQQAGLLQPVVHDLPNYRPLTPIYTCSIAARTYLHTYTKPPLLPPVLQIWLLPYTSPTLTIL